MKQFCMIYLLNNFNSIEAVTWRRSIMLKTEAVARRCSVKKMFLEISHSKSIDWFLYDGQQLH